MELKYSFGSEVDLLCDVMVDAKPQLDICVKKQLQKQLGQVSGLIKMIVQRKLC